MRQKLAKFPTVRQGNLWKIQVLLAWLKQRKVPSGSSEIQISLHPLPTTKEERRVGHSVKHLRRGVAAARRAGSIQEFEF